MRQSPSLNAGQHRMLELCFDMARDESGGEKDHREQHQADGDVAHKRRRRPDLRRLRVVLRKTPYDERKPHDRDNGKHRTVTTEAQLRDRVAPRSTEGDEDMGGEKHHQPKQEDAEAHALYPAYTEPLQSPQ